MSCPGRPVRVTLEPRGHPGFPPLGGRRGWGGQPPLAAPPPRRSQRVGIIAGMTTSTPRPKPAPPPPDDVPDASDLWAAHREARGNVLSFEAFANAAQLATRGCSAVSAVEGWVSRPGGVLELVRAERRAGAVVHTYTVIGRVTPNGRTP